MERRKADATFWISGQSTRIGGFVLAASDPVQLEISDEAGKTHGERPPMPSQIFQFFPVPESPEGIEDVIGRERSVEDVAGRQKVQEHIGSDGNEGEEQQKGRPHVSNPDGALEHVTENESRDAGEEADIAAHRDHLTEVLIRRANSECKSEQHQHLHHDPGGASAATGTKDGKLGKSETFLNSREDTA